jgi:hypothetical protein
MALVSEMSPLVIICLGDSGTAISSEGIGHCKRKKTVFQGTFRFRYDFCCVCQTDITFC